ncbi:type ISP restriction/modification enzyme [Butyrivibrio sp. AE3009]|uniref:type ISP restriction/modification enzyme n=1 Tax=Butyrivibrio sp. AE3009 TaxID=1280666 RepID=UPI0003B4B31C|nr:type ISP restriction/modification enzyme [Butyrivibrio sp. AE3009]
MSEDIRSIGTINRLITYFSKVLDWQIDEDDFEDIEDISYDFEAKDLGLKEEAFAKIKTLRQLQPLVDGQKWGIFSIEFDSKKFEVTALRKVLSGLIPKKRNSADHAVWNQKDLLFLCFWGENSNRTIGIAHFEDKEKGLPQIKMIYCAPAIEDTMQIRQFEARLKNLAWPLDVQDVQKWHDDWSNAFSTGYRQIIHDASTLTLQLAVEARGIRDRILETLEVETDNGYVHQLYGKFKDTLIHDMTEVQFADMYAQTVVYGLFSARCMDESQDDFSAAEAVECIPNTNPFLKSLMKECLGAQNNGKLSYDELEIGNVVDLLLHTKTDAIIQDFNRQTGGGKEDPVIHFYEEFLTAYDKNQKVQRGVYYTPQPVVNFIVKAVDAIIKKEFAVRDGLASTETKKIKFLRDSKKRVDGFFRTQVEDIKDVPAIQILDPSTGTGTFLRQTILQIYDDFKENNSNLDENELKKAWNEYVPKYLLPRVNGFELMMAPYAVAHMKLAMVLKDTGYTFDSNERLNVYLSNSLEEPGNSDGQLTLFDDPLASESIAANSVKKNNGINVIIGNPPYAGKSANNGEWISSMLELYKREPGGNERLKEKNPKYINDDYVKFIRLSQSIIEKTNNGVMGFICPHGFIDNPTFRGMRWQLAAAFTDIYIIDLHGNVKKKEVAEDGSKDENVFDIQQGVCLLFLIKKNSMKNGSLAKIHFYDLYGARDLKYQFLNNTLFYDVKWDEVKCKPDFYVFKPTKETTVDKNGSFNVADLFIESVAGVKTHRDFFAVSFDEESIKERIDDMREETLNDDAIKEKYKLSDTGSWTVHKARAKIKEESVEEIARKITKCQYRILDCRWCYLDEAFMDRPRSLLAEQVANKDNYVFGVGRQGLAVGDIEWCLATVSRYPIDENIFRRGGVLVSPLYLYKKNILDNSNRVSNLRKDIIDAIANRTGLIFCQEKSNDSNSFSPIDVIDYVYAILYSHKYRNAFKDDLKIDYPKIPYPSDSDYFWTLASFGKELRLLHTKEGKMNNMFADFCGEGEGLVEKYKLINGRIYINKTQYFTVRTGNLNDAWEYVIGGNQPLQKWLKDRKGTVLLEEDVLNYKENIYAIVRTMEIMDEIDTTIVF